MKKKTSILLSSLLAILVLTSCSDSSSVAEKEKVELYTNIQTPILFVGDSITKGEGSESKLNYPQLLTELTGWKTFNYSESGATWQKGSANDDKSIISMSDKIKFNEYKIVVIFAGTNDWGQSLPVGEINDSQTNTLYGAVNNVIQDVYKSNPACQIMLVTPMYRNDTEGKNSLDLTLDDYVGAVLNLGVKYNIPIYNAKRDLGINELNASTYLSDGLHPNDLGYKVLARKIGKFIAENAY